MPRRTWLLTLVALMVAAPSVRAGVYSTIEPAFILDDKNFRKFQEMTLIPLKRIGTPEAKGPKSAEWLRCYTLAGLALQYAKEPPGDAKDPLTVEDRLNMAACLLRMRKPKEAILVLKPALKADPDNFIVMSVLGTACMIQGDFRTAQAWLYDASHSWKKDFNNLSPSQKKFLAEVLLWSESPYDWYAKCERYQYRLFKLRYAEFGNVPYSDAAGSPLTFSKAMSKLDGILDPALPPKDYKPLQFVGPKGEFDPGKIAEVEKAKIPKDAILVVEQLLIWMPEDLRLNWLLGELLNASGDVESARNIFSEFLSRFSQLPEFQTFGKVTNPDVFFAKFVERHPMVGKRLQALREHDVLPAEVEPAKHPAKDEKPPVKPPTQPPQTSILQVDWQTLGVGFAGGLGVGLLFVWQLREIIRRRQVRRFSASNAAPAHAPGTASTNSPRR